MILDKNKVEEAAENECLKISIGKNGIASKSHIEAFKAGVSYAESKLSELTVEFAEFIGDNNFEQNQDLLWTTNLFHYSGCIYSTEELFQEFLKYKNG